MGAAYEHLKADYGECNSIPFTNGTGSTLNGGTIQTLSNKVGMLYDDIDDGEETALITGVPTPGVSVPRNTNDSAWSEGDTVYLDTDSGGASNDQFTTQSTTNTTDNPEVGYVYASTGAGDDRGVVVLTDEQI